VREREGRRVMRAVWAGSGSWAAAGKRKEGEVRWAAGLGWRGRFVFFLFFQILFNTSFQHLLNSNLHTNFPTFSQLFLRLFTSILRLLKPHHNQKQKQPK
jgi:hypothetical protein